MSLTNEELIIDIMKSEPIFEIRMGSDFIHRVFECGDKLYDLAVKSNHDESSNSMASVLMTEIRISQKEGQKWFQYYYIKAKDWEYYASGFNTKLFKAYGDYVADKILLEEE